MTEDKTNKDLDWQHIDIIFSNNYGERTTIKLIRFYCTLREVARCEPLKAYGKMADHFQKLIAKGWDKSQ